MSSRFWILTKEIYDVALTIGKPEGIDSDTFDRFTGCAFVARAETDHVPGATIPFEWTVRQVWKERPAVQSKMPSITPPGNACSSTADGHVLPLGAFSVDPGEYVFEFHFTGDMPQLKGLHGYVAVTCCGKSAHMPIQDRPRLGFFRSARNGAHIVARVGPCSCSSNCTPDLRSAPRAWFVRANVHAQSLRNLRDARHSVQRRRKRVDAFSRDGS